MIGLRHRLAVIFDDVTQWNIVQKCPDLAALQVYLFECQSYINILRMPIYQKLNKHYSLYSKADLAEQLGIATEFGAYNHHSNNV